MFVLLHLQVKLLSSRRCYFQIMLIFSLFFLHQLCVVLCNLQRGAKKPASCEQALWWGLACEGTSERNTDDDGSENVRAREGSDTARLDWGNKHAYRIQYLQVPYLETLERWSWASLGSSQGKYLLKPSLNTGLTLTAGFGRVVSIWVHPFRELLCAVQYSDQIFWENSSNTRSEG